MKINRMDTRDLRKRLEELERAGHGSSHHVCHLRMQLGLPKYWQTVPSEVKPKHRSSKYRPSPTPARTGLSFW